MCILLCVVALLPPGVVLVTVNVQYLLCFQNWFEAWREHLVDACFRFVAFGFLMREVVSESLD